MIIQKAFKFKFNPTPAQIEQLSVEFGCARFVWNHTLNLRQVVYEYCDKENLNYVALNKYRRSESKPE